MTWNKLQAVTHSPTPYACLHSTHQQITLQPATELNTDLTSTLPLLQIASQRPVYFNF